MAMVMSSASTIHPFVQQMLVVERAESKSASTLHRKVSQGNPIEICGVARSGNLR